MRFCTWISTMIALITLPALSSEKAPSMKTAAEVLRLKKEHSALRTLIKQTEAKQTPRKARANQCKNQFSRNDKGQLIRPPKPTKEFQSCVNNDKNLRAGEQSLENLRKKLQKNEEQLFKTSPPQALKSAAIDPDASVKKPDAAPPMPQEPKDAGTDAAAPKIVPNLK